MSVIKSIYEYAEQSDYIDTEHVLPLGVGIFVAAAFFLEITPVTSLFERLDGSWVSQLIEAAFKGVIGGLITTFAYTAGDTSFKVGNDMVTKERAMLVVLAVTVGVGFGVEFLAPNIIDSLAFQTLQLAGLVFLFALIFVHLLVRTWRLENEWPHVLAGGLVVLPPML